MESSGDPVALTYWRWRLSWNPFEVYRPASSAVGMFQLTDGTFAEGRLDEPSFRLLLNTYQKQQSK